jgi:triacylglycerol esterase/lipase EstA (alpha/beta hydrolase family)
MKLAAVFAVLIALAVVPASAHAAPACTGEPVVLVHGTFGDSTNWGYIKPQLKAQGYCTYAIDYGRRGTGDIPTSAKQLAAFVDGVLATTGAAKVDIVGHSQGGMMPRYFIKNLGGAAKVDDLIGLAPSNHGTDTPLAASSDERLCAACRQQAMGSDFLTALNAGDETPGDVDYTVVETRYDEVVTPYTSALLDDATNVLLQDKCPHDVSEHLSIMIDQAAVQWIEDALAHSGPADPGFSPACV